MKKNLYLFTMKIEISNAELLDKLSILEIKLGKIQDPEKLINIRVEYSLVKSLGNKLIPMVGPQYESLVTINRSLWEIEDTIRDFERNQQFGDEFVQTARKVYQLNDERARIKREINRITNSGIVEEKSYSGY
jgi:hypothetical protein